MVAQAESASIGSAPRQVVPTALTWLVRAFLGIALLLTVFLPSTVGQQQIQDTKDLVHKGQVVEGKVESKDTSSGKGTTYYLDYDYDGPAGPQTDRASVSHDTYDAYSPGDPIQITYVRARPSVDRIGRVTDDDIAAIMNSWYFGSAAAFVAFALLLALHQRSFRTECDLLREGDCTMAGVTAARKGIRSKNGTTWQIDYQYQASGATREGTCSILNPREEQVQIGAEFPVVVKKYSPDSSRPLRDFAYAKVQL